MSVHVGVLNHEDGSKSLALGKTRDGDPSMYETVAYFPEPGGEYEIAHDVPKGTAGGEFSS